MSRFFAPAREDGLKPHVVTSGQLDGSITQVVHATDGVSARSLFAQANRVAAFGVRRATPEDMTAHQEEK